MVNFTEFEQEIIRKIHEEDLLVDFENVHEQDNTPDPFRDLTLEELEYVGRNTGFLYRAFPAAVPPWKHVSEINS